MLLTSDSPLEMCALDAEHVAAVLEDCVDQLAVLGSIISIPDNPASTETVSFGLFILSDYLILRVYSACSLTF